MYVAMVFLLLYSNFLSLITICIIYCLLSILFQLDIVNSTKTETLIIFMEKYVPSA